MSMGTRSSDRADTQVGRMRATAAWRIAADLEAGLSDRAVVLHDRKVPDHVWSIDHIAVAPSGVWVIDVEDVHGRVEQRDGLYCTDFRLVVGGKDRSRLIDSMPRRAEAVTEALGSVDTLPVIPVICFVHAEWPLLSKPFKQRGVWVTWPRELVSMISTADVLDPPVIDEIAAELDQRLPAA
jgi:hypothetical protein